VKTAVALAKYEKKKVSVSHIELAMKGRQEFQVHVKGEEIVQSSHIFN
jgi:hypothetical protein